MGRTLVQWASHARSAPRHAACIGISQQWRAYLTDGNSVTQAQVTSIKKNFINLTVLAGDRNSILVAGALLRQPIRLSYRERRDFWAFQNELALLGAGGSLRRRRRVSAMAGVEDKVMVSRSWPSLFRSEGILAPRVLPWRASPIRRWYRSNLIRGSLLSTSGPGSAESQHAELCRASLVCSSSSLFAPISSILTTTREKRLRWLIKLGFSRVPRLPRS